MSNNPVRITAAMLYDMVQCPHRPTMELFGDPGHLAFPPNFSAVRMARAQSILQRITDRSVSAKGHVGQ